MRALKLWLDRSLTAQAVLIFVLGVGANALFRRDGHLGWWVVQTAVFTAVAIAIVAAQRRRTGRAAGTDPRGIAELNRRIRHREVPSDPEQRATMRRLVAEQLGKMERGGRWLPYWLAGMGLIAAGMLVLGFVTGSLTVALVFAVGVAVFCSWVFWTRRRALERHRHMRSALRNHG
ncbi:hypothetical protein C5F59_011175 [Streptomyces sp. QL37]|uniref:hypothetical protein n=1 Tax=Streptomyces sp. QL37 TaxID=2093747 RepID=UPI000CF1E486|nr:hypothetical protein [Streptomyces sp. QL37]PPQ60011.1 hypothetical protein C5F59_27545 [Streptomyces sp. QL37]